MREKDRKAERKRQEKQEHWMDSMNYGDRGIGSDLLCVDTGYYFHLKGHGKLYGKGKDGDRYVTWENDDGDICTKPHEICIKMI